MRIKIEKFSQMDFFANSFSNILNKIRLNLRRLIFSTLTHFSIKDFSMNRARFVRRKRPLSYFRKPSFTNFGNPAASSITFLQDTEFFGGFQKRHHAISRINLATSTSFSKGPFYVLGNKTGKD